LTGFGCFVANEDEGAGASKSSHISAKPSGFFATTGDLFTSADAVKGFFVELFEEEREFGAEDSEPLLFSFWEEEADLFEVFAGSCDLGFAVARNPNTK